MIRFCLESGLPEPDFEQRDKQFVATIWRDWLSETVMDQLGLNELERKVVAFPKTNRRVSNQIYQDVFKVSKATATRHLDAIVKKGVLQKIGTTGKGTYYTLMKKGLIKGSKGSVELQGKGRGAHYLLIRKHTNLEKMNKYGVFLGFSLFSKNTQ